MVALAAAAMLVQWYHVFLSLRFQSPAEEVKCIPGASEHDLVEYKAGYDVGPSNPFPQTEPEAQILAAQKEVQMRLEAFDELKKTSEEERKKREKLFKEQLDLQKRVQRDMMSSAPPGTEEEEADDDPREAAEGQEASGEPFNPDDPSHYQRPASPAPPQAELPAHLKSDPAFHNDQPLEFFKRLEPPPAPSDSENGQRTESQAGHEPRSETSPAAEKDAPTTSAGDAGQESTSTADPVSAVEKGEETQEFPEAMLPQMKPMPDVGGATVSAMALEVGRDMENQRKKEARERLIASADTVEDATEAVEEHDEMVYTLDELTRMGVAGAAVQGPELNQDVIEEVVKQQQDQNNTIVLERYWHFVKANKEDFNGWCYLIQHAEVVDALDEVRKVYNAFLPLFPYCYAYWQRYSEVEKKHGNWQRALAILHRGLEAIPLSVDLWISYLELYRKLYRGHEDFAGMFRAQCERAIHTAGLDFRSDALWERYLEWENEDGHLDNVTAVYKRLVSIPTKLYNRHWDNFIAHIRDHHPRDILEYAQYEELRKVTCHELDLT
jgi:tetratricopeptide (TPR) repeat protein